MAAPPPPIPERKVDTGRRGRAPAVAVHSAELNCEVCGLETPHRILHLIPGANPERMEGVARCQVCRTTHPFRNIPPRTISVRAILSEGRESRTVERSVLAGTVLSEDSGMPGRTPTERIRRIELRNGRSAHSARVEQIGTLWLHLIRSDTVPLSIVEGRLTTSLAWGVPADTPLTVGDEIRVKGERLVLAALRARRRTWMLRGDTFRAAEVERVYARRYRSPPAGSRAWSTLRETPSSAARATSVRGRSRSSPGVTMPRSAPRERRESGGATDQSISDS